MKLLAVPLNYFHIGGDCSLGFLDLNSISEGSIIRPFPNSSLPKSSHLFDFSQWMFPNVRFTCNGFITSWRLMVRIDSGFQAEDPLQIPQITTWKLISLNSGLETDNYMQYTITNITEATVKAGDGYIEYTPSPPTQVHAGDFVGIEMPTGREFKEARMRVRPLFLKLPHENSNATSCLPRVANINFDVVVLSNGLCLNQPDQQYPYIPLLYATFAGELTLIIIRFIYQRCYTKVIIYNALCRCMGQFKTDEFQRTIRFVVCSYIAIAQ